jgi:hypothetical protein
VAPARDVRLPLVIVAWIGLVLAVDHSVGAVGQAALGAGTWALLLALVRRESRLVRAQVAVVIVFATLVEYVFSPVLDVYTYRLGGVLGVPSFVPPGHGLVYLAALCLGRSALFARHAQALIAATVVLAGGYAVWGLWVSPQPDALGAFWYLCLLGFLRWGRMPLLYVGAFCIVTALELVGTRWGVWTWASSDPTGWVSIGNPPSVAAGGYGWFDLAAVALAPYVVAGVDRLLVRSRRVAHTSASADNAMSCSGPLVVTAQPAASASDPSNPEIRPPDSVMIGTRAAMSHADSSGSTAMSTAPSATSRCDQKSP